MRSTLSLFAIGALASVADAHVGLSNVNAAAGKSAVLTFSVGHGCTTQAGKHLDTRKIRVSIPAGVTSVRALFSDFGAPTIIKDAGTITHVEWQKPVEQLLDADDSYYEIKLRIGVPNVPFTKLRFNVEQTCEDSTDHSTMVVNWDEDEGSSEEPAAFLKVVPARTNATGWNKLTIPVALTQEQVATYFGDATIVWRGMSAYSPSSVIATLITSTPGVTALDGIAAGEEIWVKY